MARRLRTGAIIQARMTSSRLPGKTLAEVIGRPLLELQLDRIRRADVLDEVMVATSDDSSDDPIQALCHELDVRCYRGPLDDVLARYHGAAAEADLDTIVRLTGDCPLVDPEVIDDVVGHHTRNPGTFVANTIPPEDSTYPDGMDVEVFSRKMLITANEEARLPSEREHVTFFMWKTGRYPVFRVDRDSGPCSLRLTVDYPQDLEVVRRIFEAFEDRPSEFTLADIERFLQRNPDVARLNRDIRPNQGWLPALERDKTESE